MRFITVTRASRLRHAPALLKGANAAAGPRQATPTTRGPLPQPHQPSSMPSLARSHPAHRRTRSHGFATDEGHRPRTTHGVTEQPLSDTVRLPLHDYLAGTVTDASQRDLGLRLDNARA